MWYSISTAPFGPDLELAVIESDGSVHALVFPCRRKADVWIDAVTKQRVEVWPTHWREWSDKAFASEAGLIEDAQD
jgi:hypothetical protein